MQLQPTNNNDFKASEGKLFHKFMFPEGVFRLVKWNSREQEGSFVRLCDNYKVPLDPLNLKEETIKLATIQSEFYILDETEEKEFEGSLDANKLRINYKEGIDMYVFGSTSHTYCEPVKVSPADLPIQEVTHL